ncbi:MAG: GGDEF domain-containing protein [Deltaproteobacteria bacterium]|nr:GGDEF domain-containing protein [Deltaproteobacteria bacterium]
MDKKDVFMDHDGAISYLNLINACQVISASLELDKIFGIIQGFFSRELGSNHTAIYTMDKEQLIHIEDPAFYGKGDPALEEILDIALQASSPLYKMIETQEFYRFIERGQLTPGLFVFRFQSAGNANYFCVCLSPKHPVSLEAFEGQVRILKAQIELTVKNIEQYKGVQHLAYVDDVTGLYNTRYLSTILDHEILQYKITQKSFAILFIDADKFKGVNDTHGHLVGTKLLNELGRHLKNYVRDADTVFRYGGDEFVAVLSPCDLQTAKSVAERIRKSVEKMAFLSHEGLNFRFTVSIGVALFPDHANSKKAIIEAADKAMYTAKKTTRNRVFIAGLENILNILPLQGNASVRVKK